MKNNFVICKKNLNFELNNLKKIEFKEGLKYEIDSSGYEGIIYVYVYTHRDIGKNTYEGYTFYKNTKIIKQHDFLFDDYFCTLQEYRKLKLEKIEKL